VDRSLIRDANLVSALPCARFLRGCADSKGIQMWSATDHVFSSLTSVCLLLRSENSLNRENVFTAIFLKGEIMFRDILSYEGTRG